ncbi:tat protein [Visna-maedi virus]|uniref:Probable Vpr-like protein n=1 Tax=Maedi visna virus (strain KV1772) TaxID=36374 RepID=VPRL_VILVK|nr:tat protein [Visna-maedi virus]P35958.1 RecName: Full=Probable Vpr-like protein; AltName: Full=Protein S; AltName: Full=Protein Tat [Visna/maedi virus EV1 KV1772]pir/D45390/ trans-activating transcription regulator - Maedi/Visna virus (strain KV1772) (provirus) [Visna-maedi virus]AAA48361.1 tat protein [Visna-maedi virus]AAB25462.1 tat [Visna-maedi virus]
MEEVPRRQPGGLVEVEGVFQFYEDWECWDYVSQRVPGERLQRWLAMLTNNQLRRQVIREAQIWMWKHKGAAVRRNCGCRLCNPGWGSQVRNVEL